MLNLVLALILIFPAATLAKPKSGYVRKDWPHWIDADRDCQNTRAEILIRDSIIPVTFHTAKRCRVKSGEWLDPYTFTFFENSSDLDIEHIVPLKNAFVSGGHSWGRERRRQFANDGRNLIAVSKRENRRKGSRGPASYKPPNSRYWCQYSKKWMGVKSSYGLSVVSDERLALNAMCME